MKDALLPFFTITESFSAMTRARNKSHTTSDTEVTRFSRMKYRYIFFSITESLSAVSRARSESITRLLLLWSVARFSTNMRFGELNLHRRTLEHHRVPLGSDLMRVVNHTLLLIRGVSRFLKCEICESNSYRLTLGTTESLSALTRAHSKSHTTPNTGVCHDSL